MPLPTDCLECRTPLTTKPSGIAIHVMGDEYIYTYYYCAGCEHYTVKVYHDRFAGEDVVSFLPPISKEEGDYAVELIEACATPQDKTCECPSHKAMYYGRPGKRPK